MFERTLGHLERTLGHLERTLGHLGPSENPDFRAQLCGKVEVVFSP